MSKKDEEEKITYLKLMQKKMPRLRGKQSKEIQTYKC